MMLLTLASEAETATLPIPISSQSSSPCCARIARLIALESDLGNVAATPCPRLGFGGGDHLSDGLSFVGERERLRDGEWRGERES